MGVDRVSTYGAFLSNFANVSKVDADIANLQNQISSGVKSQNYAGLGAQAAQYLQLSDKLARNQHYLENNNILKTRINATGSVLTQVIESATELKNLILQRRNASLNVGAFSTQATAIWKTIAGQLNTSIDGRYLFSGARTDTKAVDDQNFPQLDATGAPNDAYYQGDSEDLTVRASETVEITYNVRANDSGFQKLFAGLALAREGDESNSDSKLAEAYDLIAEGIGDVITTQAEVNTNAVALNNIEANITSLQTYWKGVKEEIGNTDLITASTLVSINQAILQASFQAFAKISSLRLSDFLR
jgi:flagellar hook-associated protein 3 FlgL